MLRATLSLVTSSASPPRTLRRVIEDLRVDHLHHTWNLPSTIFARGVRDFPPPDTSSSSTAVSSRSVSPLLLVLMSVIARAVSSRSVSLFVVMMTYYLAPFGQRTDRWCGPHWRNSLSAPVNRFT